MKKLDLDTAETIVDTLYINLKKELKQYGIKFTEDDECNWNNFCDEFVFSKLSANNLDY